MTSHFQRAKIALMFTIKIYNFVYVLGIISTVVFCTLSTLICRAKMRAKYIYIVLLLAQAAADVHNNYLNKYFLSVIWHFCAVQVSKIIFLVVAIYAKWHSTGCKTRRFTRRWGIRHASLSKIDRVKRQNPFIVVLHFFFQEVQQFLFIIILQKSYLTFTIHQKL